MAALSISDGAATDGRGAFDGRAFVLPRFSTPSRLEEGDVTAGVGLGGGAPTRRARRSSISERRSCCAASMRVNRSAYLVMFIWRFCEPSEDVV